MTYTDETLRSFLEGALPEGEARRLETEMMADDALQRRIMALDGVGQTVGAALRDIPEPARIKPIVKGLERPKKNIEKSWSKLGGLAAMLVLGLGLGWGLQIFKPSNPENWRMEVARYQALYVPETVAHLSNDASELKDQFDRASAALGLTLPLEQLSSVENLELRRAQVLGINGDALIQIAFRASDGTPFALCITKGTDAVAGVETLAGLAAFSWANNAHQFLLIGGTDLNAVEGLGEAFQKTVFVAG